MSTEKLKSKISNSDLNRAINKILQLYPDYNSAHSGVLRIPDQHSEARRENR